MKQTSKSCWFPETKKRTLLEAGQYQATLVNVTPGEGKDYNDGSGPKKTITFSFITEEEEATVNRTVNASISPKSACFQLVKNMVGLVNPKDSQDPEKFQELIVSLIGKEFVVCVEPSPDKRFNNLVDIAPVKG